jgi:dCTP deaminase
MSVLNRDDIVTRIRKRELVISPLLAEKQLGTASVDLRIGNVVLMVRARGLPVVEPVNYLGSTKEHQVMAGKRQKHERYDFTFEQRFLLHPGTLALVPTLEWVRLPADVQGFVTARSSWAREGLSIATASFIGPLYEGSITLELANLGQIPISLYPGLRIAQIAFYGLENPAKPQSYDPSQFQSTFEPAEGDIAKDDEAFLPKKPVP